MNLADAITICGIILTLFVSVWNKFTSARKHELEKIDKKVDSLLMAIQQQNGRVNRLEAWKDEHKDAVNARLARIEMQLAMPKVVQ